MKLLSYLFFILVITLIDFAHAETQELYPFDTTKQQQQFQNLNAQLRCLVCQNQSLAESNAALAKDLRAEVYKMVKHNDSDEQIKNYMLQRYGDFILFKPSLNGATYFLWLGPFLILLIAFSGLLIFIFRNKKDDVCET